MKKHILILLILFSFYSYSQVGTGAITLDEVRTEIGLGTTASLQDCVNNAVESGYDGTYYTSPATSLAEFRGYTHPGATSLSVTTSPYATVDPCAVSGSSTTIYANGTYSTLAGVYNGGTNSGELYSTTDLTTYASSGWYSEPTQDFFKWYRWDSSKGSFDNYTDCTNTISVYYVDYRDTDPCNPTNGETSGTVYSPEYSTVASMFANDAPPYSNTTGTVAPRSWFRDASGSIYYQWDRSIMSWRSSSTCN